MEVEQVVQSSYTVFNVATTKGILSSGLSDREDNPITFDYAEMPNNPRRSLNGRLGIVTGIFGEAPDCYHLTQQEAEELMSTVEWSITDDI